MADEFPTPAIPDKRLQRVTFALGKKRYRLTVETHTEELKPEAAPVIPIKPPA